ncbi:hypothetical protein [Pectinatus haikarae]|uniref:Polysaccharide deacetylase n=1 Tax=Pectinatus haikarae TaxID=349096 RepID=A0ABT9Y447_9FIRM|nr:hypothetical protein [Pectinatus haikarae]MDQ0202598.1 hypothetical protein [Pectinatus haikarae]
MYDRKNQYAAQIVYAACIRSFTKMQVCLFFYEDVDMIPKLAILIEPNLEYIKKFINNMSGKYVILGKPNEYIADLFALKLTEYKYDYLIMKGAESDKTNLFVKYVSDKKLTNKWYFLKRYFSRYDYADEWNNNGYGAITVLPSYDFSVSCKTDKCEEYSLASVFNDSNDFQSEYLCLKDLSKKSILWMNRKVGPVDSLEWTIIEEFFANYRLENLQCIPYVKEIPAGYQTAVTMRLDCDQAVTSAKRLFELYCDKKMPISLALVTNNNFSSSDWNLINAVTANGGSLLSHSQNHFPDWGGCYTGAYMESLGSRLWLEKNVGKKKNGWFAVSPFHKNPRFAVDALIDSKYSGFVGGIIHNDPQYMLGRSGQVPFISKNFVELSQQCMLHGDCYNRYNKSIKPYIDCFESYYMANGIFGYLDHPSSETYQYGWNSEAERISVHSKLLDYIGQYDNVWKCNIEDALLFIKDRNELQIYVDNNKVRHNSNSKITGKSFEVVFKNKKIII